MARSALIQSKSSWQSVLQRALKQTEEFQRLDPSWSLMKTVRTQLEFMQSRTENGRAPTSEESMSTTIGPIAAKNFETTQPEYAEWLMELDYWFRRWDSMH
jgi:hypothetical protein